MGLDTLWVTGDQFLGPGLHCFFPIEGADHTQIIVLGCVGGIVAVGLGLVLAYRLSVEIYDRREFHRFEQERQHLNWKQVRRLPPPRLGGVFHASPGYRGFAFGFTIPNSTPFLLHTPHPRPVPPLQAYPGSSAHFHQFLGFLLKFLGWPLRPR